MILEAVGASMLVLISIRLSNMSDKKKIEKIFEYTKTWSTTEKGEIKKCQFIRKSKIINENEEVGVEYVYRLPLGMPSKKLEYLNKDIGVFKDGLHKDVEVEYDGGMLHMSVYETGLPSKWDYEEAIKQLKPGTWSIPIGKTFKGYVWRDFDKIPHTVIGGTTRYGKTVNLKSMMTSLILSNPDEVEFYVIDLKRKLEFGKYENLKQVTEVAGTPEEAFEMLERLRVRYDKLMDYFLANGYTNITETPIKKRIFVIIDEGNRLVPQGNKDMLRNAIKRLLEDISSITGGLGIRLMFCTQYPVGTTLPRDVKQNSDAKMAFRLQSKVASGVVLGEENGHASDLPDIPGRCITIHGPNLFEMQVPYIKDNQMEKLLQDHYVTKRKDVTPDESTSNEHSTNVIEFRDID